MNIMTDRKISEVNKGSNDVSSGKRESNSHAAGFKAMANGKDLAKKLRAAGYDISQPTEQDNMLCYPHEEKAAALQLHTCPPDPRFQQQNVTKWCYRMYLDYKRCAHLLGKESEYCDYFYKCYHSLCPVAWHTKWDEQIETGTFPRVMTIDMQPKIPKICDPDPYPVPEPQTKDAEG